MRNIFVIGLDGFSQSLLRTMPGANSMRFHALLGYEEAHGGQRYSVPEMLRMCRETLDSFNGSIDGIIGLWDYPVSIMVHLLSKEYGLPHTPLESVFKCEHKYWSRVEQHKIVPEMVPQFTRFDPFADSPLDAIDITFPFWVKPIKAFGSHLAFKVESKDDFQHAVERMREGIDHFQKGFESLMQYVDAPQDIARGGFAIAEGTISSQRQFTLEGYFQDNRFHVHGVVDSILEEGVSSFNRYMYPSNVAPEVRKRMAEASEAVLRGIGFNFGAFNIEFFLDEATGKLSLLELNTRVSQSHTELFRLVDGSPNLQIPVQLALGEQVDFPYRQGKYPLAAKLFHRTFSPGIVRSVPTSQAIADLEREMPSLHYFPQVSAGDCLAAQPFQDSYSFTLALYYLGADSEQELLDKIERVRSTLTYDIEPEE